MIDIGRGVVLHRGRDSSDIYISRGIVLDWGRGVEIDMGSRVVIHRGRGSSDTYGQGD